LFMGKGALADVVLSTPATAHEKAKRVAKRRGEAVDPSRPPKGAVDWEDRAASVLLRFLIGYGEADLKFRRVEKEGKKGFQVFRTYGGVETFVGELWIGKVARFDVSEEELRRFVEEARRKAPDLSGFDKAPQYLEWCTTDVTFIGRWIEGATVHPWQLRWYFGLLGEEKSFSGGASVTKEGIKPNVTARWPREREDQILRESRWLKSLLGRTVNNWRELVDAIDWSWVLKKVEGLADELKPWIGPEGASDAERNGLARRMLGELALIAHFAEARRGMDDGRWREERTKRLAKAVEALSGGRITGDHANELAKLIILYAERRDNRTKNSIDKLAEELAGIFKEDVKRVREDVWGIVDFILNDMYCLARDCARDAVVRKFVAPALELIMLDKALRGEYSREEALLIFGEMYATAVAGDGTIRQRSVELAVGGELGGGATLLRLATLLLLNQLMPDELKFDIRTYVKEGRYYHIVSTGENAAGLMRLLAVSAPSAGGEYLSDKFNEFVEAAKFEVRLGDVRPIDKGRVAADLTISEAGVAVKYNIYLSEKGIELQFQSSNRSWVEFAARLLRHAGVSAEVRKVGSRDVWYVYASTDKLAAGREEFRKALAEIVETARKSVGEEKAKRWLEKLERGLTLMEGWPKYGVRLKEGALEIKFGSTDPDSIQQEVQRLEKMGLKRGVHFTVKMPEGGEAGYVYIRREGLAYAAWLSVHSKDKDQRELAADFVKIILQRAEEACGGAEPCAVYEKAKEIVEEGKAWGSLTLKGFEKKVEVEGREYVVKVIDGEAVEEDRGDRKLLRIRIIAEVGRVEGEHIVDRVVREYIITFGRYGRNMALGFAAASAKAPGGKEADAERLSALIEALTGRKPKIIKRSDGQIVIECSRAHLDGFMRYAELADAIAKWLEETKDR